MKVFKIIQKKDLIYEIIQKSILTTTDSLFLKKLKLSNIYEIERNDENYEEIGNKKLLWYWTRYKNYISIILKGLRIIGDETPECINLFGKGLYFYDSIGSIPFIIEDKEKFIFVFLCEVSLGNTLEILTNDYFGHQIPYPFDSIKACGKFYPSKTINFENFEIYSGPVLREIFSVILI